MERCCSRHNQLRARHPLEIITNGIHAQISDTLGGEASGKRVAKSRGKNPLQALWDDIRNFPTAIKRSCSNFCVG